MHIILLMFTLVILVYVMIALYKCMPLFISFSVLSSTIFPGESTPPNCNDSNE